MQRGVGWTRRDEEMLRGYWASNVPLGQIVHLFRGKFTRSALCGKAHRLGLAYRNEARRKIIRLPGQQKQKAMIDLRKRRWSVDQIAVLFRCDTKTVRAVCAREEMGEDNAGHEVVCKSLGAGMRRGEKQKHHSDSCYGQD